MKLIIIKNKTCIYNVFILEIKKGKRERERGKGEECAYVHSNEAWKAAKMAGDEPVRERERGRQLLRSLPNCSNAYL